MTTTGDDFTTLWDFSDPALSEERFRALLEREGKLFPPPRRLEILTQIARAQGLQRRFEDADATLDEVERQLVSERGDAARARVRYLLERGRVRNSSGDPVASLPRFREAWELARAIGDDSLAVDAAHMLGIALPVEEQVEWGHRALALAESSADPDARRWLGSLYNNIGWSHHDRGEFAEALALFEKALEWRRARGEERPIQIARWAVARAQRSLGRLESALETQRALLAELDAAAAADGYVLEELAECLLALGHAVEARPYFARAHEELAKDPWLAEREPERLKRLEELGRDASDDRHRTDGHRTR